MEISIPITRTKLIIPRRRGEILSRPRLLSVLEEAIDDRLIIVAAPAGYGKTSLLVDFVHQTLQPVCWLSLDDLDRDPQRFIAHFIAGIQTAFPDFGKNSMPALQGMSQARLNLDALVSLIINDIYETITEHFIFVLDDYHLVEENPDINYFINRFIMSADENCHLVISSRRLLPLADMPLLVARSSVGGLGFEDLAFRLDEIQNLYLQNHRVVLNEAEAGDLARVTEGWITGLVLSTNVEHGRVTTRVRSDSVTGVGLYEYLAQQVLDRQNKEIKEFLFRSSLLDEFDAERCEEVIGKGLGISANWGALMDEVQRNNLFTLPVIEDHIWLRYHHLFRDFLQAQMTRLHPAETRKIHLRLAEYYQRKGDWERAHQVCDRLGDEELTIQMIVKAGQSMIAQGRLLTLKEWIEKLPTTQVNASAGLLSILGAVMMMLGDPKAGIQLTTQAIELIHDSADAETIGITYVRRSTANRMAGNIQPAIEDADKAIQVTLGHDEFALVRGSAYHAKGAVLVQSRKLADAKEWLQKARGIFSDLGYFEGITKAGIDLGMVLRYTGQFTQAETIYRDVLQYFQKAGNVVWQANILNNLGVLHYILGDYPGALEELENAIQYARMGGYLRVEAYALTSLGDLFRSINSNQEAEQAYRTAGDLDAQIEDQFLHFYLIYSSGEHAVDKGMINKAQIALDTAVKLAMEASSTYEDQLCNCLRGRIALENGYYSSSIREFKSAHDYFLAEGHIVETNRARLWLAAAAAAAGDLELARSVLVQLSADYRKPEFTHLLMAEGRIFARISQMCELPEDIRARFDEIDKESAQLELKKPGIRKQLRRKSQVVKLAPPELTITTFGKIQIKIGDHVVTGAEWMSQNARDLLLLLMLHPQGLTKEEIGEIFWPDSTPAELKLRFKNTIYRLRHAAGKDAVTFNNDTYAFNHALDYEADFEIFANHLSAARRTRDASENLRNLKAAIGVYKGHFMPDVSDQWAILERERLHQQAVTAMFELTESHLKRGELTDALQYAKKLLEIDPMNESVVCLAMRAHAASGNLVGVVQQYEQFKRVMKEEMNASPAPATKALFENLTRERQTGRKLKIK